MQRSIKRGGFAVVLCVVMLFSQTLAHAAAGDLTLASTSTVGVKGNRLSRRPALSGDGTRSAFYSQADNLDPADTDFLADVYTKDLGAGTLTLVSTSSGGTKGNGDSADPALSNDGDRVGFHSFATNIHAADTDGLADVYVKDLVGGILTLASTSSLGTKGNGDHFLPSMSADGTKVAFESASTNLDPGDPEGVFDIYVKDLVTGGLTLASMNAAGTKGNGGSHFAALSGDGTKVAFQSTATNLDPADTDGDVVDVYVKDLVSGALTLVSVGVDGAKGNEHSAWPSLSADGTKVAYTSFATNLHPADTDLAGDIYVKDTMSGAFTLASVNGAGTKGDFGTVDPVLSADGMKVAYASFATNLDPADTDFFLDVYVKDLEGDGATVTVDISIKKVGPAYRVAILSDGSFDATGVDPSSVCFGDAEDPAQRDCTARASRVRDVDGDGDLDMVLTFEAAEAGIDPGDTQACLTGLTVTGAAFEGCGPLRTR